MEELKQIKDILVDEVQAQMHNLHGVNAKELGEVIDMIKDLSETMYYCSIVKAMDEGSYTGSQFQNDDRALFTRGYTAASSSNGGGSNGGNSGGNSSHYYHEGGLFRNYEGRSPMSRRMYMENKMNGNTESQVQELENYMQELTSDLSEMIQSASPDEKQLLQRKISALAAKLQNV